MAKADEAFAAHEHRRQFGDTVRRLRQEQGWSQEQLAEAAGLHRTYVTAVEGGQRNISLDAITALAKALERDVRDLFPPPSGR